MNKGEETLTRRLARKIARQVELGGWHDAADYVRSDFMAVQINLVLREAKSGEIERIRSGATHER
ncbi:Arc/MetJ-type ribon-helix-helix transcriptional regulator [Labrenzia sp. EL_195]|nr:Arc/MetJ-type ribon-helix-helix transcriptional regulator [Labrenzia sp. EL_195]